MMKIFAAAALAMTLATGAHAATIATGGTGSTGAGGITFADGSATTDWVGFPGAWTTAAMIEDAIWVRDGAGSSSSYKFEFDLSGYDLSTVVMSVDWAVDNSGNVTLNGSHVDTIASGGSAYSSIHSFSVGAAGSFVAGLNTLFFNQSGDNTTDGLRAAVRVTGDLSPVPLPAGGLLLISGLGAIAAMRRRRKA